MKKYKLPKDIPGVKAGTVMIGREWHDWQSYDASSLEVNIKFAEANPDFFEPIVEKKKFEDLREGDVIFSIGNN